MEIKSQKDMKNKVKLGVILVILALLMSFAILMMSDSSYRRSIKSWRSNVTGGLNRTVTVYSATGEKLAEYHGKIDVEVSDSKVLFDLDGKRTIIYNGTVIVQEE